MEPNTLEVQKAVIDPESTTTQATELAEQPRVGIARYDEL